MSPTLQPFSAILNYVQTYTAIMSLELKYNFDLQIYGLLHVFLIALV